MPSGKKVDCNAINTSNGIIASLFGRVSGAFPYILEIKEDSLYGVCTERLEIEREDDMTNMTWQVCSNMTKEKIEEQKIPYIYREVMSKLLATDSIFVEALKERVHNSALVVLDIHEPLTFTGCKKISRDQIAPHEIKYIILNKKRFESMRGNFSIPPEKIIWVESIASPRIDFNLNRRNEEDCFVEIPMMEIPNYQEALTSLFKTSLFFYTVSFAN